jgi:hypothetical protein
MCLTLISLVLGCDGEATPKDMTGGLALVPIDSIRLAETDSVYLGLPTAMIVTPREIIASDAISGRVLRFGSNGSLRGTFGTHRGQGPGEFVVPGAMTLLGDSAIVIADWQLERLNVFRRSDGQFSRSIPALGLAYSMTTRGDSVLIGMYGRADSTSSAILYPSADTLYRRGRVPDEYRQSAGIRTVHPYISVATTGEHFLTGFTGSNSIYDATGTAAPKSFAVPTLLRRAMPEPEEMVRRFETNLSDSAIASMGSTLVALYGMQGSKVVALNLDVTVNKQLITAQGWASVLNMQDRTACVDAKVPSFGTGKPVFDVVADTLFVLDQRITEADTPESWVFRYRIDDSKCDWKPLIEKT